VDLQTDYLGLSLRNPLVASASPLSRDVHQVRQMEDAGLAAVVMFSLFEEEIHHGELTTAHYRRPEDSDVMDYFPDHAQFETGPDAYLAHIEKLKEAVDIPIIGSLNGATPGGWTEHARQMEAVGADAIELNLYHLPTDPEETGEDVEDRYLDILAEIRSAIDIPVAVKLGPYFSAMANMAHRLDQAGADGLVLFNRFYQPDIDLDRNEPYPHVVLSTPFDLRLPLRWIAILHGRVKAHLAHTGGIHDHEAVIKAVMVGAQVTMMASALMERGIDHAHAVLWQMEQWLEAHQISSITELRGRLSQIRCDDPSAFERANYIKALETYS